MLSEDLVTQLPSGGHLVFPRRLFEQCQLYAQKGSFQSESGGVLIGCIRDIHIEITGVTFPDSSDKQSRFSFVRRSANHVKKVLAAWKRSGRTETYLGEWHTHPEAYPSPSMIDLMQWRKKLAKRKLVLLIVGTKQVWLGFWDGRGEITTLPNLKADFCIEQITKPRDSREIQ